MSLSTLELAANTNGVRRRAVAFDVSRTWGPGCACLELELGDITHENTDAIVNPAGPGLVDLSIRRAAGPELLEAFHRGTFDLPGGKLARGYALLTPGFGLPAANVIHCAPPVYSDGAVRAREQLAACHSAALRTARENGLLSISFPAMATGVLRYPLREAADVAIGTVVEALGALDGVRLVRFVFTRQAALDAYVDAAWTLLCRDGERSKSARRFPLAASDCR